MGPLDRLLIVALGVAGLALVAACVWTVVEPDASIAETPDAPIAETPVRASRCRVPTFDGGRTTIAPKISDAAIKRLRMK